jgi:hypothetical protein
LDQRPDIPVGPLTVDEETGNSSDREAAPQAGAAKTTGDARKARR